VVPEPSKVLISRGAARFALESAHFRRTDVAACRLLPHFQTEKHLAAINRITAEADALIAEITLALQQSTPAPLESKA